MTNNLPRYIARKTLIKYNHYFLNNYADLKLIIESNRFTVIEYKKHSNSQFVCELIKRLGIESEIEQNDAFIYVKNNLKFVFLREDISDEDKCSLLRHELGHICDPDLKNNEMSCSNIKKEEFANEFSLYLKNPGIGFKLKLFVLKNWKLLVGILTLLLCIAVLFVGAYFLNIKTTKPVPGDTSANSVDTYYVTSGGKKYHKKHCIIVKYRNNLTEMTLSEAVDDGYEQCMICNPQ